MAIAQSDSVIVPVVNGSNGTLEDEFISGLVQGGSWTFGGPRQISYSFNLNDDGSYPEGPIVQGPGGSWSGYPQIAAAVTQALTAWSSVANVSFQHDGSTDNANYYFQSTADLSFTLTGDDLQNYYGAVGLSFFPDPDFVNATLADGGYNSSQFPNMEGNIFLDNWGGSPLASSVAAGSSGYWVILHEIGHALGLKHTFDDGGNLKPTFSELGISTYDAMQYTVMTYTTGVTYAATPMPLDILAIQAIYGANTAYNTGDNTYTLNNGYYSAIWDAGGVDLIDGSLSGWDGVVIDLAPGAYSGRATGEKQTAIAYNVTIENAQGTYGHDRLTGNAAPNNLNGAGGNDTLDGGTGDDTMTGGWGNDLFFVDSAGDLIFEDYNGVLDLVKSVVSMMLPGQVENLRLTGSEALYGIGNALRNTLLGNAGPNLLDGGSGIDSMVGGAGDDVYVVDALQAPHALVFSGPSGEWISQGLAHNYTGATGIFSAPVMQDVTGDGVIDFLSLGYSDELHFWFLSFSTDDLGMNLLPGTYTDAQRTSFAVAGHPGLELSGDSRGSSTIFGSFTVHGINVDYSGASPVLVSFNASFEQRSESALAPALTGSINYDSANMSIESVVEAPGEGRDTVRSSVSALLPENFENLALTGAGNINANGNVLNNILSGNAGNNVLDGAAGADIIAGGPGNDTYVVDHSGDQVMELGNSGLDAVQSGVSYDLMQAWHVENLTLTDGSTINGSGNWLDNVITGNSAANMLTGNRGNDTINGGGGSDTLVGGLGDDVLIWDAADAGVHGGAGSDTLLIDGSGVTLNLMAIAGTLITDIEAIDLTGNGDNTLTLALADVLAISSTGDVLRVDGNSGDVVNAGAGWNSAGIQVIGGQDYAAYTQSMAMLLIDANIAANFS